MKFNFPFNPGNRKTQIGVAVILVLLILGMATKCHAAEVKADPPPAYPQFGVGSAVIRGATPTISLTVVYPERVGDAGYEVGVTLLGESSFRDTTQRNNFAVHGTLVDGFGRFDVGLGLAYLQNTDEYNGSHLNFHLVVGYRFKAVPVTLRVQHFSNAGTVAPNRGRDMALVFYRF